MSSDYLLAVSLYLIHKIPLVASLSLSTFPLTSLNLHSQIPWQDFSFTNFLSAASQRGHIYNSLILCVTPLGFIMNNSLMT